ncbi:MAG: hypothetical protein IPL28_07900 [Chloroflexi bacterium]|nr:hypothetical protein [Chloroflexota bacterium]
MLAQQGKGNALPIQKAKEIEQRGGSRLPPRFGKGQIPRRRNRARIRIGRLRLRPQLIPPRPKEAHIVVRPHLVLVDIGGGVFQRQWEMSQFHGQLRPCPFLLGTARSQPLLPKRLALGGGKDGQGQDRHVPPTRVPAGDEDTPLAAGQVGLQFVGGQTIHVVVDEEPALGHAVHRAQHNLAHGGEIVGGQGQVQPSAQRLQTTVYGQPIAPIQPPRQLIGSLVLVGIGQCQLRLAHPAQPRNGLGNGHRGLLLAQGGVQLRQLRLPPCKVGVVRGQVVDGKLGLGVVVDVEGVALPAKNIPRNGAVFDVDAVLAVGGALVAHLSLLVGAGWWGATRRGYLWPRIPNAAVHNKTPRVWETLGVFG